MDKSADKSVVFRQALGHFATGVMVATTGTLKNPLGITINSFSSVSLTPPLVLWCLANKSQRYQAFSTATHFALNVLTQEHKDLSAQLSKVGENSLHGVPLEPAYEHVPVLKEALAYFVCTIHGRHEEGDHLILVGQVEASGTQEGEPLIFYQGKYRSLNNLAARTAK